MPPMYHPVAMDVIDGERYWQNWDKGESAKRIDEYWLAAEAGWRQKLVGHLREEFSGEASITEVGCGSGLIYGEMADQGLVTPRTYVGGDVSLSMLSIAHKRFSQIDLCRLDIFRLPFADRSRDNVINIQVLQHLPDYQAAVEELVRITGRRLYICTWFTAKPENVIQFKPSDVADEQPYYNNYYALKPFADHLIKSAGDRIGDIRWHPFTDINAAVCVDFQ